MMCNRVLNGELLILKLMWSFSFFKCDSLFCIINAKLIKHSFEVILQFMKYAIKL